MLYRTKKEAKSAIQRSRARKLRKKKRRMRAGELPPFDAKARKAAHKKNCEIESCRVSYGVAYLGLAPAIEHIHHLIPRRLAHQWRPRAYDHPVNLISICSSCHGKLLQYENKLFLGDYIGFRTGMNLVGVPEDRLVSALKFYRVIEGAKL